MQRIFKQKSSHFPPAEAADTTGLVAITDHLDGDLLLDAYRNGIFPWSEDPVRWYSPDPRAIFLPAEVRLPRKLGKMVRKGGFSVTFDLAFDDVMRACASSHADDGVWISESFVRAYGELHRRGYGHSVEVWQDGALVGGLYGVQIGGVFSGESMFYRVSNASKVAFAYLMDRLAEVGIRLVDAQVLNEHTYNLGAMLVPRAAFLEALAHLINVQCRWGHEKWPPHLLGEPSWKRVNSPK